MSFRQFILSRPVRRKRPAPSDRVPQLNRLRNRVAKCEILETRIVPAGIWISNDEIMGLPTSGPAWETVLNAAQQPVSFPNLQDQDEDNDVFTLAKALVGVRLNDSQYLEQARELIMAAVGTETVSGNAVIGDPRQVETTVTFTAPGTYLLRLRVDDGMEDDEDAVTIRVHAAGDTFVPTGDAALDGTGKVTIVPASGSGNEDPDVYAGADQVVSLNDVVTLRGSVSDDGRPNGKLDIRWEFVEPRTLALGRNLVSYIIAADIAGLSPNDDAIFKAWLQEVLGKEIDGRTLRNTQEERPNNWGTMAAASRAAAALYLGDQAELDRTAQVFRGFLGDRSAYDGFIFDDEDLSWQADPQHPVGINPLGAMKNGHSIDGAMPDEMRRGDSFRFPPAETHYPWEGLQGIVTTAELLYRAGYDSWQWQDQAILRSYRFIESLGWEASRDDEWIAWVLDARYSGDFTKDPAAGYGKNIGWTSWTHQFGAPEENRAPLVAAGPDLTVTLGTSAQLNATVTDDGRPDPPGALNIQWSMIASPSGGTAIFSDPSDTAATVYFNAPGRYTLELSVSDGEFTRTDAIDVVVLDASAPLTIALQDGSDGYRGTTDTRIRSDQPTANFGTSTKLELDGNPDQVSLIRWDLQNLPLDSRIMGATLTVNVVEPSVDDFEIYQAARSWDESTATFQLAAANQPWGSPGAAGSTDRSPVILGKLAATSMGLVTIPLNEAGLAVLQQWIQNPTTNFGFVIQDLANESTDDLDWSSSEAAGLAPRLTISYTVGPPPPPNEPPLAGADSLTVAEDDVLRVAAHEGVLANDSDPESDSLSAVLERGPQFGQLTFRGDGSFDYTPSSNFHGSDTFVYRAVDSVGNASAATTVSIAVSSVNDIPLANGTTVAMAAGESIAILLAGSDIDGDLLSFTVTKQPTQGTLVGTAPNLTYTPNSGFVGIDQIEFHVNDGTTNSATATVSINVAHVNSPPTAVDQSVGTDEDSSLTILLQGSDIDGDSLQYQIVSSPAHGSLSGIAPNLSYTPNSDFHGDDQFQFRVHDGSADSAVATVLISVQAVNDLPTVSSSQISTNKDAPVPISLSVHDVDGDSLIFEIDDSLLTGALSGTAPDLIYTPPSGFVGTEQFAFQVYDGQGYSELGTVTINVRDAAPVTVSFRDGVNGYRGTRDTRLRGDQPTGTFGTSSKLELDGNPDQVSLVRWDLSSIPVGATVTSASMTVNVVEPSVDDFEIYAALKFWDELTATYLNASTGVAWQVAGAAGATDREDEVMGRLTSAVIGSATVQLNSAGLAVLQRWIQYPTSNFGIVIQDLANTSTDDLDFSARESAGLGPMLEVTYTLGPPPPPNNPPTAVADTFSVPEDSELVVTLTNSILNNDHDPEGTALSSVVIGNPSAGALDLSSNGTFRYSPQANFNGTDTFTYAAVDAAGKSSSPTTVTITVSGVNDEPIAESQSVSTSRNTAVAVKLTGIDADGDSLTYRITRQPSDGTLTGTVPNLIYTPRADFAGTDSWEFVVDDGTIESNPAQVSVEVNPAIEPIVVSFQDGVFPTTNYRGTEDTTIRADKPKSAQGTNSKLVLDGNPDIAALLRWDVTAIPVGSNVTAASIVLNVLNTSPHEFSVYQLFRQWVESTATFNESDARKTWQTAGAQGPNDRGTAVLGSIIPSNRGFVTIQLNAAGIATLQSWIDDPQLNKGLILQNYANAASDNGEFTSSEGSQAATRPKLIVEYTPATPAVPSFFATLATSPDQNRSNPYDANADGSVTPGDVLVVMNVLNRETTTAKEGPAGEGATAGRDVAMVFPDVNGDYAVTPLDALPIINFLNMVTAADAEVHEDETSVLQGVENEPEGESAAGEFPSTHSDRPDVRWIITLRTSSMSAIEAATPRDNEIAAWRPQETDNLQATSLSSVTRAPPTASATEINDLWSDLELPVSLEETLASLCGDTHKFAN